MNFNEAIAYAQLVNEAYAVSPSDLTNSAGKSLTVAGIAYTIVTTIYANDLATDMNPTGDNDQVSIGLVIQQNGTGDVIIAIRGTEGILEWIHDAEFLQVACPFLAGAGQTEDGFTAMYMSLRAGVSPGSLSVVAALSSLPFPQPARSMTICGHSLGGAIATLLALDVAANTQFKTPTIYTFASPRTGNPTFVSTFDRIVTNSFRVANRLDLVPHLPLPPQYQHVATGIELNPIQLTPFPPKVLVKSTIPCEHSITTYLYLLSVASGGTVIPLDATCAP